MSHIIIYHLTDQRLETRNPANADAIALNGHRGEKRCNSTKALGSRTILL